MCSWAVLCVEHCVTVHSYAPDIHSIMCVFLLLQRLLPAQEGEQFKSDFDGFHMREEMYTKFPDAHFYWRVIFLVVRKQSSAVYCSLGSVLNKQRPIIGNHTSTSIYCMWFGYCV